jgi:hypothetical protein
MLHLDEGVIHELLDGELGESDADAVRRHLSECGDCLRLYQEAREMATEADRVIAALDDIHPELNEGLEEEMGLPAPPAASVGAGAPVVLMPTGVQASQWRRIRPRNSLWAAVLLLLAGGGYLVFRGDREPASTGVPPTLATFPMTSKASPATDSLADAQAEARATEALATRPPLGAPGIVAESARGTRDSANRDSTRRDSTAHGTARDSVLQVATAQPRTTPQSTGRTAARNEPPAPAAKSLAAGQRGRATVDFGAADNAAAAREPAAPAGAPTSPPTLDVQAQITTRIGLDDAKRTLGTSLHAIDGLRPRLVGLVPGRLVPGADPTREVVRAVYLDQNGQPFYLDQQRVGPSGPRRAGGIVKGDVQLFLNGNVPPDSARALEQRLR